MRFGQSTPVHLIEFIKFDLHTLASHRGSNAGSVRKQCRSTCKTSARLNVENVCAIVERSNRPTVLPDPGLPVVRIDDQMNDGLRSGYEKLLRRQRISCRFHFFCCLFSLVDFIFRRLENLNGGLLISQSHRMHQRNELSLIN